MSFSEFVSPKVGALCPFHWDSLSPGISSNFTHLLFLILWTRCLLITPGRNPLKNWHPCSVQVKSRPGKSGSVHRHSRLEDVSQTLTDKTTARLAELPHIPQNCSMYTTGFFGFVEPSEQAVYATENPAWCLECCGSEDPLLCQQPGRMVA